MMFLVGMLGLGHRSALQRAHFGEPEWWIAAGISVCLVLFAGIMSGLTLGLMSLGLMDLEVLQRSGSEEEKRQASKSSSSCLVDLTLSILLHFLTSAHPSSHHVLVPYSSILWLNLNPKITIC